VNRADTWRAIEASQARMMALANDLVEMQARMPDPGVDPLPEERILLAAIDAEGAESKRLSDLLRLHARRRLWLGVAGMLLGTVALIALVFVGVGR
jgi:hypothetical protein